MTLRTLLRNTVAVPPMAVVLRSSQAPAGVSIMPKPTVLQDREFDDRFYNLWGSYPRTIGIAVSGGVDSMALAWLTRRLAVKNFMTVHAFIVDHGARAESSEEAQRVADIMKTYKFKPHILKLSWGTEGLPNGGFETLAREARYQALAHACVKNNVKHLLMGHHLDDLVETVMMRMIHSSRAEGLRGMKKTSRIPESWGIYGADAIQLGRPLLKVPKAKLKFTCEEEHVKWFEDPTNADPSLTARNAIRALLFADPPVLPKALQKPALANLARRATSKDAEIMRKAREFVKGCQVKLNPLIGTVQLRLPQKSLEGMKEEVAEVLLRALTIVAGEVTPLKNIKRKSMVNVLSNAFRPDQTHPLRFTAAGLVWFRDTKDVWNIQRVPHTLRSRAATTVEFKLEVRKWSEWKLWDGRWWIRIMSLDGSNESVVVRPLMQEDLKQLKKRLKDLGKEYLMDRYLRVLRHNCRFTVPVVAIEEPGLDFSGILVALPSFNLDLMNKVGGQGTQSGKLVRWEMEFRRPIS